VPEHKLSEIVDMLINEVDFLIDDKLRENLENASKKNTVTEKLDVVKKCLNIDSIDEM
jgi:dynein regulatory complex protein 1